MQSINNQIHRVTPHVALYDTPHDTPQETWLTILSSSGGGKGEESRARTDQSFTVPLSEIQENDYDLSINRYKEIVYEEIEYDPPTQIIADIKALDKERSDALANLEKLISEV